MLSSQVLKNLTWLAIDRYKWSPSKRNETGICINYHEKLPALKYVKFKYFSDKHPIHFLPEADKPVVTSVETISLETDNSSECDAISILKCFGNLKNVTIPMYGGVLQAVCQTQPNLEQLRLYKMHIISPSLLGEMLTGLKRDEITMLENIGENILDNLTLDFEYYNNNTEAGDTKFSIGCLKRLQSISIDPKGFHNLWILPVVPSFAVFKILLLNMDSLQIIGMGSQLEISMKDLPRDLYEKQTFAFMSKVIGMDHCFRH